MTRLFRTILVPQDVPRTCPKALKTAAEPPPRDLRTGLELPRLV
jgi:hypothetical protein